MPIFLGNDKLWSPFALFVSEKDKQLDTLYIHKTIYKQEQII